MDIHDRRPLVLTADAVREWLSSDTSSKEAELIAKKAALPENSFLWHPVTAKVGSPKNQGKELIQKTDDTVF